MRDKVGLYQDCVAAAREQYGPYGERRIDGAGWETRIAAPTHKLKVSRWAPRPPQSNSIIQLIYLWICRPAAAPTFRIIHKYRKPGSQ